MKGNAMMRLLGYGALMAFVLLMTCPPTAAQSGSRYTLWLDGPGTTSSGWQATPAIMKASGYELIDLLGEVLPNTAYQPELGVEGAAQQLATHLQPYDDVLVLAHDYGGLVARQLANISDKVGALVLLGVPNYGSGALEWAVKPYAPNNQSKAEELLDQLKIMKQKLGCEGDCALLESFEGWIEDLRQSPEFYAPMFPQSPELLQLGENLPDVPWVVIYGSVSDFSLSRFLSSIYFDALAGTDPLGSCETFLLNNKKLKRKRALILNTVNNLNGFLNILKSIIADASGDSPVSLLDLVANAIQDRLDILLDQINAIAIYNQEVAQDMRCMLINIYLETEWQTAALYYNASVNVKKEVIEPPTYQQCYNECMALYPGDPYEAFYDCIPQCLEEEPVEVYYFDSAHDGLLTQSEQMLDGAAKVYHLPKVYHPKEPVLTSGNTLLDEILTQIFDGDAGAAFAVPK
ncbi:MAG: alpha/beta hydrolase [Bacteroidetes bacterium]|nr:MAG: alpha/beta hydrolase [Bacteroidota bacterium]